jgi:hypothetical protein
MERGFHFGIRSALLATTIFAFWFWCLSLAARIGEVGVAGVFVWIFLAVFLPAIALAILGARPWLGLLLGVFTAGAALVLT